MSNNLKVFMFWKFGSNVFTNIKMKFGWRFQESAVYQKTVIMLKMELHKEIAAWLAKFKLIPANSKALTPSSEIEDLVAIIRDGVVLCQVKW